MKGAHLQGYGPRAFAHEPLVTHFIADVGPCTAPQAYSASTALTSASNWVIGLGYSLVADYNKQWQEALTVKAGLQDDRGLQAQALYDGVLDAPGGCGCACQEWCPWELLTEALQCQVGRPAAARSPS